MALVPQIDNAMLNDDTQTQFEIPSKTYKLILDTTAPLKQYIDPETQEVITYPRALPSKIEFQLYNNDLIVYLENDSKIQFEIQNGDLIIESDNEDLIQNYSIIGHYLILEASDAENFIVDRINGYVENIEAIRQAIYHILSVERYAYLIYSENYGVELQQYIGKDLSYIEATIGDTLKEALTYDLRIIDVVVNSIQKVASDIVLVNFTANTIYGNLILEVNINV